METEWLLDRAQLKGAASGASRLGSQEAETAQPAFPDLGQEMAAPVTRC